MNYKDSSDIPDEEIRKRFEMANEVSFSARRYNHLEYRYIAFDKLGWWLPLKRVLPLIGITPQMLRSVFNLHLVVERTVERVHVERPFPLNLVEAAGLLCERYRDNTYCHAKHVDLPQTIETYEQLGFFPLSHEPFQELAQILGKSVEVLKEGGGTGDHYHLFTVHPSGEIVEAAKA